MKNENSSKWISFHDQLPEKDQTIFIRVTWDISCYARARFVNFDTNRRMLSVEYPERRDDDGNPIITNILYEYVWTPANK